MIPGGTGNRLPVSEGQESLDSYVIAEIKKFIQHSPKHEKPLLFFRTQATSCLGHPFVSIASSKVDSILLIIVHNHFKILTGAYFE